MRDYRQWREDRYKRLTAEGYVMDEANFPTEEESYSAGMVEALRFAVHEWEEGTLGWLNVINAKLAELGSEDG